MRLEPYYYYTHNVYCSNGALTIRAPLNSRVNLIESKLNEVFNINQEDGNGFIITSINIAKNSTNVTLPASSGGKSIQNL